PRRRTSGRVRQRIARERKRRVGAGEIHRAISHRPISMARNRTRPRRRVHSFNRATAEKFYVMNILEKFSIARLWAVVVKEFVQMRRDRLTFGMMLGVPIMQLILFGFAINSDPKHLPAAVLLADN